MLCCKWSIIDNCLWKFSFLVKVVRGTKVLRISKGRFHLNNFLFADKDYILIVIQSPDNKAWKLLTCGGISWTFSMLRDSLAICCPLSAGCWEVCMFTLKDFRFQSSLCWPLDKGCFLRENLTASDYQNPEVWIRHNWTYFAKSFLCQVLYIPLNLLLKLMHHTTFADVNLSWINL